MPLPDHYRCEKCGRRYVIDFAPVVMCAAHDESDDCHTGERMICADGSIQWVVADTTCLPYATTEWAE